MRNNEIPKEESDRARERLAPLIQRFGYASVAKTMGIPRSSLFSAMKTRNFGKVTVGLAMALTKQDVLKVRATVSSRTRPEGLSKRLSDEEHERVYELLRTWVSAHGMRPVANALAVSWVWLRRVIRGRIRIGGWLGSRIDALTSADVKAPWESDGYVPEHEAFLAVEKFNLIAEELGSAVKARKELGISRNAGQELLHGNVTMKHAMAIDDYILKPRGDGIVTLDTSLTYSERGASEATRRGTKARRVHLNMMIPVVKLDRPKTRADCASIPRPCPWAGCRHHMLLDITEIGTIKFNLTARYKDPLSLPPDKSCVLDIVEANPDGITMVNTAKELHITKERLRQIYSYSIKPKMSQSLVEENAVDEDDLRERRKIEEKMPTPKKLYKTTIIIWSEFDPEAGTGMELEDLVSEAVSGSAYCSRMQCELVDDPSKDSAWDNNEFFGEPDDEEDDE